MAMVSSSMGPINSLLEKLPAEPEFRDLRQDIEGIKQHLLRFSAHAAVRSARAQIWTKKLREFAYNVEDWIDGLLINPWGRFKLKWWSSHRLARIQRFQDRIRHMHDLSASYGLLGADLAELLPSKVTTDPEDYRISGMLLDDGLLYGEKPCLVGLDGPESEIVQLLMGDEKELKVVTILGPGGLGKTTLAREVLQKQQSQFDCVAFVYVGHNPSRCAILMDIARQVMPRNLLPCDEKLILPCDEKLIATKLFEFLDTKRYLIVIDDIWSINAWSAIIYAFSDNDFGSRVLATTEVEHVAKSCCVKSIDCVHLLEPLNDCDSRKLMLSRISLSEEGCLLDSKILQSLLKICGGSPLAVVVAAGLLAVKGARLLESRILENATSSVVNQGSASQGMREILDVSYADLPLHVKSCFLSLSAFPVNHTISKDRLIRKWIAEGFIPKRNEESLWEVGESYFNELAGRRLIQLVLNDNDDHPIGCTVHPVIHDFILFMSSEENLVTLCAEVRYGSYPCACVRRLSLDCDTLASTSMPLSRVRSLTLFGNATKQMPDFSAFKLLRVLDLEGTEILGYQQLKNIGRLSLLRYLGLQGTGVTKLPKQIMMLEHLDTLDLRRTIVTQLPAFRDAKLASLLLDCLQLGRGIGEMQYLEELSMIFVTPTSSTGTDPLDDVAKLVNKSKRLRMLAIRFDVSLGGTETYSRAGMMHFFDEVAASNVQSLILHDYPYNLLVDCWAHTWRHHLQKLELRIGGHLSKIPQTMAPLIDLTHLHINVHEVEAESLHALGKLPNLVLLNLSSEIGTIERCSITRDSFPCLKMLLYNCHHCGMGLQFEPGAMPQLRRLRFSFDPMQTKSHYGDFNFGMQYLSRLTGVHATINCWRATALEVDAAEAAIREQVSHISNRPQLELCRDEHETATDKG